MAVRQFSDAPPYAPFRAVHAGSSGFVPRRGPRAPAARTPLEGNRFVKAAAGKATPMRRTTSVIFALAHAAAAILVIWILLDLFGANQGNALVHWFRTAADWLSGWSRGLFTVSHHTGQVLLDYGLPAVVYLALGNLVARARPAG